MNKKEYKIMADFESNYWWHRGKRYLLYSLIDEIFGEANNLNIMEVGCGAGVVTKELNSRGKVIGMDISEEAVELCKSIGLKNVLHADITTLETDKYKNKFDLILALDVLEHIQDDSKAMDNVYNMLKKGGYFFINVPAHKFLWSDHDEALQHKRRYTRFELTKKLEMAGFNIEKQTYFVTAAFLPIFIFRMVRNLFVRSLYPKTSYVLLPKLPNDLLTNMLKLEAKLIKFVRLPIGTTIAVVAKK